MLCIINDKPYEMSKKAFDITCNTVAEQKKGSYSIYCLVLNDFAEFINENFDSKDELRKKVAEYAKRKFKVKYTVKE